MDPKLKLGESYRAVSPCCRDLVFSPNTEFAFFRCAKCNNPLSVPKDLILIKEDGTELYINGNPVK